MSKPTPAPPAPAAPAPAVSPARRGGIDWRTVFAFPNPVNEYAARVTAALVVLLSVVTLLTGFGWGLAVIAAGFWLRVLFGPRISRNCSISCGMRCSAVRPPNASSRSWLKRVSALHRSLNERASHRSATMRRCEPGSTR